jgi:hypothetical protein
MMNPHSRRSGGNAPSLMKVREEAEEGSGIRE